MPLRVIAVSAPQFRYDSHSKALSSNDPVSIQNACKHAAMLASDGVGAWGYSNWQGSRADRSSKVLLMNSMESDRDKFERLIISENPNLILLGAMTVCIPGAIECARIAKDILGDQVCIVLGGRHVNESLYLDSFGSVCNHPSSPLALMGSGKIPEVFDLVVAGEGEYIISWIGELIDSIDQHLASPAEVSAFLDEMHSVPGRWIVGSVKNGQQKICCNVEGSKIIPFAPCKFFGVNSSFDVFSGRMTSHIFSQTGNGCVYDCDFCSERRAVTGQMCNLKKAPHTLYQQMSDTLEVVSGDYDTGASAFVEDSTILVGSASLLNGFSDLMEEEPLDVRFGAQLTVDQVLQRRFELERLKAVGLDYLFIGIETLDTNRIEGGMNKDLNKRHRWRDRVSSALETLRDIGIQCGASLLFGLGEGQEDRIKLFEQLRAWREELDQPYPISLNWAVQHPLKSHDNNSCYEYLDWPMPDENWREAFSDFGEASPLYPLSGVIPPQLSEVEELAEIYRSLVK